MILGASVLKLIIFVATLLVAVAPATLLLLWFRDRKGGHLW